MIRSATVDDADRLTGLWRPASLRFGADLAGREAGFGRGGWPGAGGEEAAVPARRAVNPATPGVNIPCAAPVGLATMSGIDGRVKPATGRRAEG